MKKEDLTPEEKALLEAKRKRDESMKACIEEIQTVLKKHKMGLKVYSNPEIKIEPVA